MRSVEPKPTANGFSFLVNERAKNSVPFISEHEVKTDRIYIENNLRCVWEQTWSDFRN